MITGMDTFDRMERCFREEGQLESFAHDANWRVRYAAAIAMGETRNIKWIPILKEMLSREDARSLYSQPPGIFANTTDDTRMAEQIGPIEVAFDILPDPAMLEDWRCRGRVKQAIFFAVYEIGVPDLGLEEMLQQTIHQEGEDYPVKAAAVRALGKLGGKQSIPFLKMAEQIDEWCTQTEARKALKELGGDTPA